MLNFILKAVFQSAQQLYEKREGSGAGSIPLTNGPKTCGSGAPTLGSSKDDVRYIPESVSKSACRSVLSPIFIHSANLVDEKSSKV